MTSLTIISLVPLRSLLIFLRTPAPALTKLQLLRSIRVMTSVFLQESGGVQLPSGLPEADRPDNSCQQAIMSHSTSPGPLAFILLYHTLRG